MKASYSDEQIIKGIKEKDNLVLAYLCSEYMKEITKYIINNKGNKDDAKDVFQDAIIKVYRVIYRKDFVLRKSFETYFKSICMNTWISAVKLKNKQNSTDIIPEDIIDDTEMVLLYEYKNEQLRKLIRKQYGKLGESCRKMLGLYFFKRKQMVEIAYRMDYKNAQIAMNKKHKCLIYLKELIINHPIFKNLLHEY
jgi:RNA polymerase sigma factor (sigma-70 family)